jgi:CxxC motif-containing protein
MPNAKTPENAEKFICEICDFKCYKESNFNKHLLTLKHKIRTNPNEKEPENAEKNYTCVCGKKYKHMSSLCNHKRLCTGIKILKTETNIVLSETNDKIDHEALIQELMKQNNEFKTMLIEQNTKIMELAKEGKYITNNTTNNNNFNLNLFLNEKCKDALNIMDFINQLQLNTSDLDMVGRLGYTEGISKLFIRGLKELDLFKRPIHCSDLKREVLYVKDKDSWEKDNDEKKKLKTAIKYIAAKNFKQIHEWQEEHPESSDYNNQKNTDYNMIVLHSMGGATAEEDEKNYNKIIKNVAQEVTIDKSCKQVI